MICHRESFFFFGACQNVSVCTVRKKTFFKCFGRAIRIKLIHNNIIFKHKSIVSANIIAHGCADKYLIFAFFKNVRALFHVAHIVKACHIGNIEGKADRSFFAGFNKRCLAECGKRYAFLAYPALWCAIVDLNDLFSRALTDVFNINAYKNAFAVSAIGCIKTKSPTPTFFVARE